MVDAWAFRDLQRSLSSAVQSTTVLKLQPVHSLILSIQDILYLLLCYMYMYIELVFIGLCPALTTVEGREYVTCKSDLHWEAKLVTCTNTGKSCHSWLMSPFQFLLLPLFSFNKLTTCHDSMQCQCVDQLSSLLR